MSVRNTYEEVESAMGTRQRLNRTELEGAELEGAELEGAELEGAELEVPEFEVPDFPGPNLQIPMLDRDEERSWRAERRAREEERLREERSWLERPTIVGLRATELRKAEWLEAMRWRRRVESICAASRLTFAQWLLLHSTQRLIEETKDAVIQAQIAARVELDQTTVSQLVRRLEARRLVDRGGDITGRAWRVDLTDQATVLLRDLDALIEATSRATWQLD